MRYMILAAAFVLSACASGPVDLLPASPAAVANQTKLDEQIGAASTVAYTAASRLGAALVAAGLIDKAAFKAADNQGYAAVLALKAAYDAGNATDYLSAARRATAAADAIRALVK